ncbi:MAG: ScyD/ScyE family protein [Chthoniobacterales bacterium]
MAKHPIIPLISVRRLLLPSLCLLGLVASSWGQGPGPSANVSTFATGLEFPRGLKFGPDGNLYVAEAGSGGTTSTTASECAQIVPPVGPYMGGNTARISRITPAGVRTTVSDNLPSTIAAIGDVDGIGDVAFMGDILYAVTAGAGCSHGHAGIPNAILRINAGGTTTQIADLSAFQMTHPVAQPEPDDFEPDGTWFSMLAVGDAFFAIEPNHGELDKITMDGTVTRIADISASQGHIVPTVMAYDGNFYVGNLGTFPPSGPGSVILKITPAGVVTTFATGFSQILGITFDALHRLYVLESSTDNDFPTPGTGKVVRVDNSGHTEDIATGLSFPTGMTFGPDGSIYVSNWGFGPPNMGEIVKISTVPTATSLANISARGLVQTGDNVLIGGFILNAGTQSSNVIVRGLGPSLTTSGLSGVLADPTIDLRDSSGNRLAFNNDWQDEPVAAARISAAGLAPTDAREAAIYATLAPGSYTAILGGHGGTTGVGLVEIYHLQ